MTEICAPLDGLHAFAEVPGSQRSGTDALLLAGFASPRKGDVAAELGCGAGAVPLLFCLHREFARFYAVERLPELARLARRNLEENGFSHRVAVLEGDARALSLPEKADLVCMNPPYLKSQGKAPAVPESKHVITAVAEENSPVQHRDLQVLQLPDLSIIITDVLHIAPSPVPKF